MADGKVELKIVDEKSFDCSTREVIVAYLLDRRSALCRELASVERQLAALGRPVKNPKMPEIKPPTPKPQEHW